MTNKNIIFWIHDWSANFENSEPRLHFWAAVVGPWLLKCRAMAVRDFCALADFARFRADLQKLRAGWLSWGRLVLWPIGADKTQTIWNSTETQSPHLNREKQCVEMGSFKKKRRIPWLVNVYHHYIIIFHTKVTIKWGPIPHFQTPRSPISIWVHIPLYFVKCIPFCPYDIHISLGDFHT